MALQTIQIIYLRASHVCFLTDLGVSKLTGKVMCHTLFMHDGLSVTMINAFERITISCFKYLEFFKSVNSVRRLAYKLRNVLSFNTKMPSSPLLLPISNWLLMRNVLTNHFQTLTCILCAILCQAYRQK